MGRRIESVTFAMTGSLPRNGRALRQIRLLERLAERIDVIAGDAEGAVGLFGGRVHLHEYELPKSTGVRFFWSIHLAVKQLADRVPAAGRSVFHASDLYVLPALSAVARTRKAKLVYDARELYPFVQGTAGKPWATVFWSQLEARHAQHADLVMTVSESIADRMVDFYGIERPIVVYNAPERTAATASPYLRDQIPDSQNGILVLHVGHLRPGRGADILVKAMSGVAAARLAFLGGGSELEHLRELASLEGVGDRVHFVSPVPYDELLDAVAGADVGVSLLQDTCLNHRLALPNKLFEYLTAGLPVIVSDFEELGRVVREFEVGLAVDPADPVAVSRAIRQMADDAESRARWKRNTKAAAEEFSWARSSERMVAAYESIEFGLPVH